MSLPVIILLVTFIVLLVLKCPVGFAMIISVATYLFIRGDFLPLMIIPQRLADGVTSFTFFAIPIYIMLAGLMTEAGVTKRIFNFTIALLGHFRGGLAYANVLASMFFAGISGAAIADATGLGMLEIEIMREDHYDMDFAAAVTAASSTIGPIIPPSIIMLVYASITEVSAGRLFLAGILPGIVMGLFMMIAVFFIARRKNFFTRKKASLKELLKSFINAFPSLLTPVIILAGITFGIVSPTEAGLIGIVYALFLGFLYKEFKLKRLIKVSKDTLYAVGKIMFIISAALLFGWILTIEKVPDLMIALIFSITSTKWIILLMFNFFLIFLGCFIDSQPLLLLIVPITLPLALKLNIDLVHFGLVVILNLMVGLITPPMGLCLFAVNSISKVPVERLSKAVIPFYIPLLITLLIVTYVPQVVLFLPNLLMGK